MIRIAPVPRILLGMLLVAACSSSSTAPELVRDIDTARERWTAAGFSNYRFDYRIVTVLTDLLFDGNGVPLNAMIGSFANDGGVLYQTRAFAPAR